MQVYARTDLSEELTGPLFKFLAHGTEMLRIVHGSIFPRKSAVANPHQIMQISVGFGCRFASAEFRADYSNVKKKMCYKTAVADFAADPQFLQQNLQQFCGF